ncbi:MAG TPA: hypothetical protein DC049_03820, partial [Spirochaetia bacterium]|nr:hypothetical protein [Spirochaetia bacterium]
AWNADLAPLVLQGQIRDMVEKKWGGYFIHSRVGLITEYMGKEWFDCIGACITEARKTGTQAWLYKETQNSQMLGPEGFRKNYQNEKMLYLKPIGIGTVLINY